MIVTDSPLLLSTLYNKSDLLGDDFNNLVAKIFKSYNSVNYLIERDKPYNQTGRLQTEAESDMLADTLKQLLHKYDIPYKVRKGNIDEYDLIVGEVFVSLSSMKKLHNN